MVIRNFRDKLRRHFWFSHSELKVFVLVVLALAFIASWGEWGVAAFDAEVGLRNLLISIIVMALVVFVHHAAQRVVALKCGFRAEHKLWWYGLLSGLILAVVSQGRLQFLAGTFTVAHLLPVHRLGKHRPGANISTLGKIMLVGPLANVLFAAVIHVFVAAGWLGAFGVKLMALNLWFAVCNLLPLPAIDGAFVLYSSRLFYVFIFGAVLAYALFAVVYDFWSFGAAVLVGGLLSWVFYMLLERDK